MAAAGRSRWGLDRSWGDRIGRSGGLPMTVPASGPLGGWAGRRDPRGDAVSERIVLAAPRLEIALLGRLRVRTTAGRELRSLGRHAQALFTLLALTRRPRTREAIAADLWPDSTAISTGP